MSLTPHYVLSYHASLLLNNLDTPTQTHTPGHEYNDHYLTECCLELFVYLLCTVCQTQL